MALQHPESDSDGEPRLADLPQRPALPEFGFIRIRDIIGDPKAVPPVLGVLPVSRATWWNGVRTGRYPKPVKLGPAITAWRVEDIRALIQRLSDQAA